MEVNMLSKNSNMRPAFATAGGSDMRTARASRNDTSDNLTYNNATSFDDVGSFGGFNDENTGTRSTPSGQRRAPAKKKKAKLNLPKWVLPVAAAAVVVVLLIIIVAVIASNSSKDLMAEDNTYAVYTEDNSTYRIAVNGTVLDDIFESEPLITPALDKSFAYVECDGEEGLEIYILRDKKLEAVTMDGSSVSSVIAYAKLEPGIIYEENGNYCIYTDDIGEDQITGKAEAANFIISDDASTVVYTLPVEDDAGDYKLWYYRDGTSDPLNAKNWTPVALSADGEYIYGVASTANAADRLYCFNVKEDEKYPIGDGNFGGITAINMAGDEIMYYSVVEGVYSSAVYSAKKDTSYELPKGKGIFTPVAVDPNTVRFKTFKDIYVQSVVIEDMLLDSESTVTGYTYYVDSKYSTDLVASAIGQFSPDGKYFYYINSRDTLMQVNLKDLDESDKRIYDEIETFEITQKNNLYMLTDEGHVLFYKVSTNKKQAVNKTAIGISMHDYANKVYILTEDGEVHVSEEGDKSEAIKFDSETLNSLPYFSDPSSKKTFVYVENEETGLWTIYYTSNGNSFKAVTTECEDILSSDIDG